MDSCTNVSSLCGSLSFLVPGVCAPSQHLFLVWLTGRISLAPSSGTPDRLAKMSEVRVTQWQFENIILLVLLNCGQDGMCVLTAGNPADECRWDLVQVSGVLLVPGQGFEECR